MLFRTKLFTPDYRYTANFVDAWSIDEIVLLDISRPERRNPEFFYSVVSDFSNKCFVPVCVGGGVRAPGRLQALPRSRRRQDRRSIRRPSTLRSLVTRAAKRFGSQCVVASIDARREGDGYRVYRTAGASATEWAPEDLACRGWKTSAPARFC